MQRYPDMALTVLTFEAARQYDALFQSLENELAYVQQAQQKGLEPLG